MSAITEDSIIQLKSILLSFINIFEKLLELSVNKQQAIMEQNWNKVFLLTNDQEEIAEFINSKDSELTNLIRYANTIEDNKLHDLKYKVRELIACYKETEGTNAKMLNDNMFVVKQKFDKIYKIDNNDTYTKDLKKKKPEYNEKSLVLNSFA